jgi:hypothetical protein
MSLRTTLSLDLAEKLEHVPAQVAATAPPFAPFAFSWPDPEAVLSTTFGTGAGPFLGSHLFEGDMILGQRKNHLKTNSPFKQTRKSFGS